MNGGAAGRQAVGYPFQAMPMVKKKPAAAPPPKVLVRAITSLETCHCGGSLSVHHTVAAKCVDCIGVTDIDHVVKQCCRRSCRAFYGYNYCTESGESRKRNTVSIEGLNVLFINNSRCFTVRYLQYQEALLFRGYLSSRASAWSFKHVYGAEDVMEDMYKAQMNALFLYMTMKEFGEIGEHEKIYLEDEVSPSSLSLYSGHCHTKVFPPSDPKQVIPPPIQRAWINNYKRNDRTRVTFPGAHEFH